MNSKAVFGFLAVVLIASGAVYLIKSRDTVSSPNPDPGIDSSSSADTSVSTSDTATSTLDVNTNGSFADMLGRSGNVKCTFASTDNKAPFTGSLFMADARIRVDVSLSLASIGGKTISTHMVTVGGYSYGWVDGAPQGSKVKMPGESSTPEGARASLQKTLDTQAHVSYSCGTWSVDSKLFDYPTNITFVEAKP